MIDKTESAWHETSLYQTKEEGPIVVKRLFQIKSDNDFGKLYREMQDLITKYDYEHKHPNLLSYYKGSPYNLNKDGAFLLRQFVCFNLNEKLEHIPLLLTMVEKKWLIF